MNLQSLVVVFLRLMALNFLLEVAVQLTPRILFMLQPHGFPPVNGLPSALSRLATSMASFLFGVFCWMVSRNRRTQALGMARRGGYFRCFYHPVSFHGASQCFSQILTHPAIIIHQDCDFKQGCIIPVIRNFLLNLPFDRIGYDRCQRIDFSPLSVYL